MDKGMQDAAMSTVGWSEFASGTVGLAAGQTLRLNVVNLSAAEARITHGLWTNPRPFSLGEDSFTLGPGEARDFDLKHSDLAGELLDKTGRVQIRALVRSSTRMICGNLEVFDSKTGRTNVILPLQAVVHRE